MNENLESTGEWAFTQERGKQTAVPGETPQKSVLHIRGENSPPPNTGGQSGEKFAWPEGACCTH